MLHRFKKISRGIALVINAVSLALVTTECVANWNKMMSYMNLCMCSLARITPGMTLDVTFSAPTLSAFGSGRIRAQRGGVDLSHTTVTLPVLCASFLHLY